MAAGKLSFRFTAPLVRVEQGMTYHALPVPDDIAAAWKKARVRRLVGTVNGRAVKRALMSHADGGSFIIVSRDFIKQAGLGARTPALLALKPDPRPDEVGVPPELDAALRQDAAARARWETFTIGRRRSLILYITTAKTEPTRIRRALELAHKIRSHTLYGEAKARKRAGL